MASIGTEVVAGKSISRVRWTHIAPTIFLVWVLSLVDKSNISVVMSDKGFLHALGLVGHEAELGMLTTVLVFSYGLFAPFWAWMMARFGIRRSGLMAAIVWVIACAAGGLATTYGVMLFTRALLGFAEAVLYPLTYALVANWFPMKERARGTSSWVVGSAVGVAVGSALVTSLILSVGWRVQFFGLAAVSIIFVILPILLLVRDEPRQHPAVNAAEVELIESGAIEHNTDAPGRLLQTGMGNVLRNYRYWLATLTITFNSMFFFGLGTWLPTYLKTARHFSFAQAGYLTALIWGCVIVTLLIMGPWSDRVFRRAPFAAGFYVLTALFLAAAALIPNITLAVIFLILAWCSQQTALLNAESLMHSVVNATDMGMSMGVRQVVTQLLPSLSPVLIGYMAAVAGGQFVGGFLVLALAVLVSAGLQLLLAFQGF